LRDEIRNKIIAYTLIYEVNKVLLEKAVRDWGKDKKIMYKYIISRKNKRAKKPIINWKNYNDIDENSKYLQENLKDYLSVENDYILIIKKILEQLGEDKLIIKENPLENIYDDVHTDIKMLNVFENVRIKREILKKDFVPVLQLFIRGELDVCLIGQKIEIYYNYYFSLSIFIKNEKLDLSQISIPKGIHIRKRKQRMINNDRL